MRTGSRLFRLSVLLAGTSLSLSATLPALAQPAPPPGATEPAPPGAMENDNGGDPPALAGRLSEISGTVSTHAAGAQEWSPASQNLPVTSGNAYWTEPQASATIEIGDDVLVMDGGTELDVTTLDQHQFVASEPQGAIFLGLRDLPDGQALTVTTPRGAVQITQPGQYEIIAGDTNNPTSVTVVTGAAHVTATGVDLSIAAQQTGAVTGATTFQGGVAAMQQDQFLQAQLARFQPPQQAAPPAVAQQVRYMTGGQDLARYGSWSETQQYGQLWYPSNVPQDWAPYRDGHWAYVAPWGWNWVDSEPWGFAPFHYGRWVNDGGRWGWMAGAPGVEYGGGYPVYAPALVGFVGFGAGVLAGASFGFGGGYFGGGGGIGWVPLGFREPFVPWYHVSDGYFRGINRYSGVDVRNISITNYRNITINSYANRRFATVAPDRAFVSGARMQGLARPLPERALAQGRPIVGRLPVTPTAATPGLGRAAAERFNLRLPARGAGHAGPGPQIRPGGFGTERPALRPAGLPGNVRPAVNALPPSARPGAGERPGAGAGARPGEGPGGRPGERPGMGAGDRPGNAGGIRPSGPRPGAPGPAIRPGEGAGRPGGLPAPPNPPAGRAGCPPFGHRRRPRRRQASRAPAKGAPVSAPVKGALARELAGRARRHVRVVRRLARGRGPNGRALDGHPARRPGASGRTPRARRRAARAGIRPRRRGPAPDRRRRGPVPSLARGLRAPKVPRPGLKRGPRPGPRLGQQHGPRLGRQHGPRHAPRRARRLVRNRGPHRGPKPGRRRGRHLTPRHAPRRGRHLTPRHGLPRTRRRGSNRRRAV